jgi:D-alanyl-D-alanine dipeptidase
MKVLHILLLLLVLPAGVFAQQNPWTRTRQIIVVTTPDWNAVDGTLQRYERGRRGPWRRVGESVAVVVGRTGLAWGRGEAAFPINEGPVKREGDGKSPAGLFRLGPAFGYAPKASGARVPYQQMTATSECVDDSNSKYYNEILDGAKVPAKDWSSAEQMRRDDEQYRWGLLVKHNYGKNRQPQGGSCIFLHVWLGAGQGTAGCTAMEQEKLLDVLRWLRSAARPMLLQLPKAEWEQLRATRAELSRWPG